MQYQEMQYQEISLQALITYLEGSATEPVRKQIEWELKNNPDFAEEFEDWEAFLAESDSREEGIANMKSFSEEWKKPVVITEDTSVVEPTAKLVQLDSSAARDPQKNSGNKASFFRLAMAACIVLIAGVVITLLMQGPSVIEQVNHSLALEMTDMLSTNAGISDHADKEKFDLFLTGLIKSKKYDQALSSLDSLLLAEKEVPKYALLQAMTLSLAEKNEQSIQAMKGLLSKGEHAVEFACTLKKNLAMLYAKTGDKEAFQQMLTELTTDESLGLTCSSLDATIIQTLESIDANL